MLLRTAEASFFQPYFSQAVLDDVANRIVSRKKNKKVAGKYVDFLNKTFPEALKDVDSRVHDCMTNHPSKRHVLAAAVAPPKCELVITSQADRFEAKQTQHWGVAAVTPDAFLCSLCDENGERRLFDIVKRQARSMDNPEVPTIQLLDNLQKRGLLEFADRMAGYGFHRDVVRIAKRTLRTVGMKDPSGETVFNGKLYSLRSSSGTFRIQRKKGKEVIYERLSEDKYSIAMNLEDVKRFFDFEISLKEQTSRAAS